MAAIHDVVKLSHCDDLHCVIDNGSAKYLCYTRQGSDDRFVISACDGIDLWNIKFDYEELDAHRDLSDLNMEAYLSKLRSGFKSGDMQISQMGVKLTISVGTGSHSLTFDLYEAKALEKKTEIQGILFRLAEKSCELESKLEKAEKDIKHMRTNKDSGASGLGMEMAGKASKTQAKAAPKQAGMSALNPGSKKRKTAKGIQFE